MRLGRSRTLRICAVGGAVSVGALLLSWPPLVVVGLVIAFWVFECSWQPLTDAITVNALGGRAGYARIRLLTSLGFALSTILAGLLYEQTGYVAAFVLFAACCRDHGVDHVQAARRRTSGPGGPCGLGGRPGVIGHAAHLALRVVGVAHRLAPKLPLVLLAVAFLHVGSISGFTFLSLRLLELGAGPAEVAASSALSAAMEVPSMMVAAGWPIGSGCAGCSPAAPSCTPPAWRCGP